MGGPDDFESFLRATPSPDTMPSSDVPAAQAPAAAPASVDPFEGFLQDQKKQQDASTLQQAQGIAVANSTASPDAAGQAAQVSRQIGTPQAAVETDLPRYQAQATAQQNATTLSTSPKLASWVADNPDSARVAQDDFSGMSKIESMFSGAADDVKQGLVALGKGTVGSLTSAGLAVDRAIQWGAYGIDKATGTDMSDWWYQNMVAPTATLNASTVAPADAPFGIKAANAAGNMIGTLLQIAGTAGTSEVPALESAGESALSAVGKAVGHGARAMAFPALTASVNTGQDVYNQTGDIKSAVRAAQMQYLSTTAGGVIPLGVPGNLAARLVTGGLSSMVTGEVSRQAMNLVNPQQQGFDPQQMILNGLTGAILGGAMGHGPDPVHDAVQKTFNDGISAETAEKGGQTIEQLSQIAQESKLRANDPDAFKAFVRSATEDGNMPNVYVDGATFAGALHQSSVNPDDIPGLQDRLNEAVNTGGDVQIPTEDYATHIAGTDLEKSILPELKAEEGGMTYAEGQRFYADAATDMQAGAKDIADQQQETDDQDKQVKGIGDQLFGQMQATGRFPVGVARASVAPLSEFYRTMADRTGQTPEDLFAQHPVQIAGENPGANSLDQSAPAGGLDSLKKQMSDAGVDASISEKDGVITLSKIVVPETDRGTGKGTDAMQALIEYADQTGQHVALSPSEDFGGNKKRLTDFYKRFGFVENKGKNRAFSTSESMYRTAPGKVLYQSEGGARGAFDPSTNTIALLQKADLSTFLHESGHFFLHTLGDLAGRDDAPQQIKDDMQTAISWMGGKDLADWQSKSLEQQRDMHEKFAQGFERYLMEGKAPTTAMQPLFSRFRSWLLNVYRSISGVGSELTPEVRGVFDRLLASDDAIRQTEAARGYYPLDLSKSGATDKQQADYAALGDQATQDAIGDMQARSMRDMKWASNAKSKALKALQREANGERNTIRDEVTKEVSNQPVERARTFLKSGKILNENGEESPDLRALGSGDAKLNADDVKSMYPESMLDRPDLAALRGLTGKAGMHPDQVAEMFGIGSGDELVRNLTGGEPVADQISRLTDQRMLQRHGELTDPASIEAAANEAVHNEARARFMATGLKLLAKSPIPARELARAAEDAAHTAISAKKVSDVNPRQYQVAEAKANKEAIEQAPKDPAAAVQAQRQALLSNRLAKAAQDALTQIKKIVDSQARYDKATIRAKMDPDILDQIDALRERFDFRQSPPDGPTKKQVQLQTWVDSQKALGYAPMQHPDMVDPTVRMHYKDMTVEQLRGFNDTIRSMEQIARERKTITKDGKKVNLQEVVSDLVAKMQKRGDAFTMEQLVDRPRPGVDPLMQVGLDRASAFLRSSAAELKPQQFKANQFDMHEIMGPFSSDIFERVFGANYNKLDMLKGLSNDFKAAGEKLGPEWQKSLTDMVDNRTLLDADLSKDSVVPVYRRMTRGDMLGIARHVGNESNFDKLTKGMEWAPTDVWSFLHANMSEKDWQATQISWDLMGKHWPDMVEMNRRLGNTSPEQVPARPFRANVVGEDGQAKSIEMQGGYSPIDYDPIRSRLAVKKSDSSAIDPSEGLFGKGYFRADTTTNGSLNARVANYYDRLDLDYHSMERRLHDTVHDLAYREALLDVHKILSDADFRKQFNLSFGPEQYKSMQKWIGDLANGQNRDAQLSRLGAILGGTRRAIVANGIALRVSTTLKHGGSAALKSLGYFNGGGEKYFAARLAAVGTHPTNEIQGAMAKFPEIRARLMQQDRDYRQMTASMFEPESMHAKAERFGHSMVAWSDMMTAVPTAWAAYDRAITDGISVKRGGTGKPMSEEDAVKYASQIVREAHGSNIESSRSMLMQNNDEGVKMLTTLYGFMNNTLGQNMDMVDKFKTAGFSKPEVLSRYMMAMIVPALWAGALAEQKKAENGFKWAAGAIAGEYAGMVPMVRDAWAAIEGYRSAGLPAYMSAMGAVVKPGQDVVKAANGKDVKAPIKDLGNAIGLAIPGAGQIGTSLQYLADVHSGKAQPHNALDVARGVLLGQGNK
jgi:hypothetical protein